MSLPRPRPTPLPTHHPLHHCRKGRAFKGHLGFFLPGFLFVGHFDCTSLVSNQPSSCPKSKKLGKKLKIESEMRNDNHLAQLESQNSSLSPELGQIVAMTFLNFPNEAMNAQPFEQA